ncbi:hypothetical protein ACLOJK_021581 [Asimina triloba]
MRICRVSCLRFIFIHGPLQNAIRDGWLRTEDGISYGDDPWILAAQTSESDGVGLAYIHQEMNEANGEDGDIAGPEDLGYEAI